MALEIMSARFKKFTPKGEGQMPSPGAELAAAEVTFGFRGNGCPCPKPVLCAEKMQIIQNQEGDPILEKLTQREDRQGRLWDVLHANAQMLEHLRSTLRKAYQDACQFCREHPGEHPQEKNPRWRADEGISLLPLSIDPQATAPLHATQIFPPKPRDVRPGFIGFAKLELTDGLMISGIRLVESLSGKRSVAMPDRPDTTNSRGYSDLVFPMTPAFRSDITQCFQKALAASTVQGKLRHTRVTFENGEVKKVELP